VGVLTTFASISQLELGDLPAARTLTLTCSAAKTLHSTYPTVQKVVDRLNALDGFTANGLVTNVTTFLMTDADYAATITIQAVAGDFFADLFFFVEAINDNSQYVTAARDAVGVAVPANTATAIYLSGGSEGTTTIAEWTEAFEKLRKRRVNIIVPLTRDPAVHALLLSHLVERAGRLRSEANGYIGIGKASDASGETKTNIKSASQTLQSRHLSFISEEVQRANPDTGEATWYPPYVYAAIAGGMQAGGAVGEPLTRKKPFVLDRRNDASWSVEDDVEELIDAGLMMSEKVDNVGIRWVRSVTGHLADDNVAFTEMSANAAANHAVFELRAALEQKIGRRGLGGTAAAIKGIASDILGRLVDDQIIVAYRALQVEQIGDVFPVSVEIAPVLPINFIPITVHLVAVRTAA
jgi:hypothetical protein